MSKRARSSASIALPQLDSAAASSRGKRSAGGCGSRRPSKRGRWRAVSLILVHVAIAIHIAHWWATGRTITPVEPSEAIETLGQGLVNAGFILFVVLILSTLILGRFFCGWGCHVVALQDLCSWILNKIGLKPKPFRSRLLMLAPILAAVWMFLVPTLFRIYKGNPAPKLAAHLTTQDFWARFPDLPVALLTFFVCGFAIVYLLGNKAFCTYGCPYGGIFGLADKVAPGRIRVTDACEGCAHCTATCTSNVRVHEEVRLYGMVVNPGCMKCMDCISVCPKDALYFGFGAPAVLKGEPRAPRKPRKYDYSRREEIAMGIIFLSSVLIFRKLYDAIPFLLSLGLATISAYLLICAARMFYTQNVRVAFFQVRRDGKITRAGISFLALAVLWTGLLAHSGAVRFLSYEGSRRLEKATTKFFAAGGIANAETTREIKEAMSLLEMCDDIGLVKVPNLMGQLGSAAAYIREHDRAERYFRRAVKRAPKFASAHYQLARYAQARGENEAALERLRTVMRLDPDLPDAHKDLVTLLVELQRPEEALRTVAALRERRPRNVEFRLTEVSVLSQVGQTQRALEEGRRLVEEYPNLASAHFGLGAVHATRRDLDAAMSAFERSIELDPGFAAAHAFSGRVMILRKDWAGALAFIQQAQKLVPFNADFTRDWIQVLSRMGKLDEEILAAEKIQKTDRLARFNLKYLYKAAGRSEDAQRLRDP